MQKPRSTIGLFVLLLLFLEACGGNTPGVTTQAFKDPSTHDHALFTQPCSACHEYRRLPPAPELNLGAPVSILHGLGGNCAEAGCHAYAKAAPVWKPVFFNHTPYPSTCWGCHTVTGEKATHAAQGECSACHSFPKGWKGLK